MDVSEIRKMREAAEEERLRKDADRVQTNGATLVVVLLVVVLVVLILIFRVRNF